VALPRGLNPDVALQLLQQSGHAALPGEPMSDAWLQALIDALVDLSSRDALTGLANRRSFELALAREIDRVARSGEPALLLTLDIDHFKKVNDTHGHAAGDLVIQAVGRALAETVRPMDLVARVGGEEFSIVLPNRPPAFGPQVAERIRKRVARHPVEIAPGESVVATVGVAAHSRRNGAHHGATVDGSHRPAAVPRQERRAQSLLPRTDSHAVGECRRKRAVVRQLNVPRPVMNPAIASDIDTAAPAQATAGGALITAVTSGKGGVGKTFVTANLAAALARQGERAGARCRPRPG
jgi:diguanylate cyclase (GGDEF)-like protein